MKSKSRQHSNDGNQDTGSLWIGKKHKSTFWGKEKFRILFWVWLHGYGWMSGFIKLSNLDQCISLSVNRTSKRERERRIKRGREREMKRGRNRREGGRNGRAVKTDPYANIWVKMCQINKKHFKIHGSSTGSFKEQTLFHIFQLNSPLLFQEN